MAAEKSCCDGQSAVLTVDRHTSAPGRAVTSYTSTGIAYDREEQTEGICAVGAVLKGVTDQTVAVSVPVPAQRFYRRESELAQALLTWVEKVDGWFATTGN